MTFFVLVTENAPPRLRGRLSLLLLEVRAGVYRGSMTTRMRDLLWEQVTKNIEEGSAVLGWPDAQNPAGGMFQAIGPNRRQPYQIDGLTLVQFESATPSDFAVDSDADKISKLFKGLAEESAPRERG